VESGDVAAIVRQRQLINRGVTPLDVLEREK
jgi:hypothetical protein